MGLIQQIRSAADGETRRDLADSLISELVRHAVAEEMYVYPAMRKHLPDGEKAVEHDIEEHKELEQTMKALEGADVSSAEFDEALRKLESLLADHVQDEETEQFPELRRRIPQEVRQHRLRCRICCRIRWSAFGMPALVELEPQRV